MGDQIPIEQRAASEVTHVFGVPIAPDATPVENPAFDITPHRYVTAIITERGVVRAPYTESLKEIGRYRRGAMHGDGVTLLRRQRPGIDCQRDCQSEDTEEENSNAHTPRKLRHGTLI